MSKSEWVIEGIGERLCVFPGQDGNWITASPSPSMLIYASIVPPFFLVIVNNIYHLQLTSFHFQTEGELTFVFQVPKLRIQRHKAQRRYMWWVEREKRTRFACAILKILHKSGFHDRRWHNASLIPTEMTVMYSLLSIWN